MSFSEAPASAPGTPSLRKSDLAKVPLNELRIEPLTVFKGGTFEQRSAERTLAFARRV
jgi:hypothetical protein